MDAFNFEGVVDLTAKTLVTAGSTFSNDKKEAYRRAIASENNPLAKWTLECILKNAEVAEKNSGPLCDDTGIPHLYLEIGEETAVPARLLPAIKEGVSKGLQLLPGRPMAVLGNDYERLSQCKGMSANPEDLEPAPMIVESVPGNVLRLHVLMQGGGPSIRGKTLRIFHKHDARVVLDELVDWAKEATSQLGCSPCTLAIGIGRSASEATSFMMRAQIYGRFEVQTSMERYITDKVNEVEIGPLGLGGSTSVLATFMEVGPQRASGVRIACLRPCCCYEPRHASCNYLEVL